VQKIEFESELREKGWDVDMRGKNIAFAHFKDGTGKTTSCLNVAGYLHEL
jgi:hypothetical protein